jgi:hypothetical protein
LLFAGGCAVSELAPAVKLRPRYVWLESSVCVSAASGMSDTEAMLAASLVLIVIGVE